MREENTNLSKLLRLKRFEQPGAEYFEDFLHEFQRRQRAALLRRTAWQVTLDRLEVLWQRFTVSQLSYAAASAAVLAVAGVMAFQMLQHPGTGLNDLAHSGLTQQPIPTEVAWTEEAPREDSQRLALDPQERFPVNLQMRPVQTGMGGPRPRYVIDARPVSYEPPFSF